MGRHWNLNKLFYCVMGRIKHKVCSIEFWRFECGTFWKLSLFVWIIWWVHVWETNPKVIGCCLMPWLLTWAWHWHIYMSQMLDALVDGVKHLINLILTFTSWEWTLWQRGCEGDKTLPTTILKSFEFLSSSQFLNFQS